MEGFREEDWVSLNVYVGAHPGAMDFFVTTVIPQALAPGGFDRWFFVRSIDERGVHARFRLRARPGEGDALKRRVMLACNRALDGLGSLPAEAYRPLVAEPSAEDSWRDRTPVAVRTSTYDPELEKYGGEPGISTAEELFEVSSRIAVDVLRAEQSGGVSRKTLAPCLMDAAVRAFGPRDSARFWSEYALHWLGGDSAFARDWLDRFRHQARLLRERDTPVVASEADLPPDARDLLAQWKAALERARRAYRAARTFEEFPAAGIGFHFIHIMNNRLGLDALEEAYLATLLGERAAADTAS